MRFSILRLGITLAILSTTSIENSRADDWAGWRGVDRANRSPEKDLFSQWGEDGPTLEWIAEGLGSGYASLAVVGDLAYTTGNFDDGQALVAIDVVTGSVEWRSPLTSKPPKHGYPGSRTTPTVDGDSLYVVTSDGEVVCVDRLKGKELWRRSFDDWNGKMMSGWGFSESPLVDGDLVLCTPGGSKGMVVALQKDTGKTVWSSVLPEMAPEQGENGKPLKDGAGYSSIMISNGAGTKQYVQLVGRGLIGIRASDGEVLWRYVKVSNGTANIPTPLIQGDYVFTSTAYNTGSALLKLEKDGDGVKAVEQYWLDSKQLQNKHGCMTLVDGYIYCGHGNGKGEPICVELKTGKTAWGPIRGAGRGEATLVYADNHIVWRREDGTVILSKATPDSFDVLSKFKPAFQQGKTWAHPVISGGKLYLREQGKLMCYNIK